MSHISFRAKIFTAILGASLLCLLLPLGYAYTSLHDSLLQEMTAQARREVTLAAQILAPLPADTDWSVYLGRLHTPQSRLTLLSADGHVLGDSALAPGELVDLDNHSDRPEVRAAQQGGTGVASRHSNTQGVDFIYAATRLPSGQIVRAALPFVGVKNRIGELLHPLLAVIGGAAVLALALAFWLSARLKNSLRHMVRHIESIADGEYALRLRVVPGREFIPLSAAVNRMAGSIEGQIRTIAAQKSLLESVLDTMRDGVLAITPDGQIRSCNRAMREVFPALGQGETSRPRPLLEVIPNTTLHKAVRIFLRGAPTVAPDPLLLPLDNGSTYRVTLGRPQTPSADDTLGAVAVFHDCTERLRLDCMRRDFVANVSHELRTPLTSIQGSAETLLHTPSADADATRRFLEIILKNSQALRNIVDELLVLTRLENTPPPAVFTQVRLADCLDDATRQCRALLDGKDLRVERALPSGLSVQGDAAELTRVFRNLLENACRYAPQGSAIDVRYDADRRVVQICDTGTGIPAEDLPRIFERFYCVEKHRHAASTGLGLAICKHIVERHKGRIWAESPCGAYAAVINIQLDYEEPTA